MFGKKQLDFLAIGDITTDAFIRIKDAKVNCDIRHEHCLLCLRFGDKVPYEFVEIVKAVGNSANASVSASRLGLKSGLITNIGSDQNGADCLAVLKKENIDTSYVSHHKKMETNYHYVLWYEAERTILVKHQPYPYKLPKIVEPKWLYLSSLGGDTVSYHDEIINYVKSHSQVKLAFQPGTFQINLGKDKLKELYARTEVFICNKEEAQKILDDKTNDLKTLLTLIHNLGPKLTLITDGPLGAYFYDGVDFFFMPTYPDPKPPYSRTGAGDAYASTFVSALALGKTSEKGLQWAGINSMSVVQQIGAQKGLLPQIEIEKWMEKAPSNYKLNKI